jgi:flagellar assembly protein FliH
VLPDRFEIIEDVTLKTGDCMIESDGGIWDCGLGTQLELLVKQLKILSYEESGDS